MGVMGSQAHPSPREPQQASLQPHLLLSLINCQSVNNKRGEFQNVIDSLNPDIVVATEAWLSDSIRDGEIGAPHGFSCLYNIHRHDRHTTGGGVFIAVRNTIPNRRAYEYENDCEMVWTKIDPPGSKSILVCGYYRPHVTDISSFTKFKESISGLKSSSNAHVWILGDLNFPGIDWDTVTTKHNCKAQPTHQEFINLLDDCGLVQIITKPTRELNTLDLFITNNPTIVNRWEVLPGISDHDIIFAEVDIGPHQNIQNRRMIPLYKKANWEGFYELMKDFSDSTLANQEGLTAESLWIAFRAALDQGIKSFIPHRQAKKKDSLPWITPSVRKLMKRRNRLFCKQKKLSTPDNINKYREAKRLLQKALRQAYWSYINNVLTEGSDTQTKNKRFWTYVKHCKRDSVGISSLKDITGTLRTDPLSIAEVLNNQFVSVFSPPSPLSLAQLCQAKFRTMAAHNKPLPQPLPRDTLSPHKSMPDIPVTLNGVEKLLTKLKPNKAPGPDQIKPLILSQLAKSIAPIICKIFQLSLDTGDVPSEWKTANVAPVFKKGNKFQASNYRPISLTCVCSKLMEHIVVSAMMNHLEGNNILHDRQHGFRPKRSCETQLVDFGHQLCKHL
jgi:hypothetical protein